MLMKKNLKKTAFYLFLSIGTAFAEVNAADFTIDGISELQGQVGNWVYFKPTASWVSQAGCNAGGWIGLDISTEGGQAAYSNLLLAFANDYSFKVRLLSGSCSNNNTYDSTTMIRLIK